MPTDLTLNAFTRFSQDSPSIAALPGGGFVAVWDDSEQDYGRNGFDGFNGVYGRVFNSNGAPVTPEFRVAQDTYNQQFSGQVVTLPDGSFVVAWDSNGVDRNGVDNDFNVYVRRFTIANGVVAPTGPQTQITPDRPAGNPRGFFDQYLNDLVALPDGGFRVAYTASNVRTDWSVYTQRFDARGQRVGGEGQMNSAVDTGLARAGITRTPGYQLLALADGGFWATYWEEAETFPLGDQVWLQRHDAAGTPVGVRRLVSAAGDRNDNTYPSISALDGGGFAINWRTRDDNDLDNYDAYVRTFDAAGTAVSAPVRINTELAEGQSPGSLVALPGGYFVASYASFDRRASSADLYDARARLFSPAGQPLTAPFDVSQFVYEDMSSLVGQRLADGRIAFAWSGGGSIEEDVYGTVLGAADLPTVALPGGAGDDVLAATPFPDLIDGGPGRDAVLLGVGLRAAVLGQAGADRTVTVGITRDTLRNIEELRFLDGRLVFDPSDPAAQVARMFRAALGRDPDQGGLNFWIAQLQAGAPLQALADAFAASPEFTARFGTPDPAAYVTQLYQNILGRDPDPGGLQFWTGQLATVSRGAVLAALSESPENKSRTAATVAAGIWDRDEGAMGVARLYDTVLGRLPDASGLAFWRGVLPSGGLAAVADALTASAEFAGKYGALGNRGFVEALYVNTLGRAGDAGGVDYWANTLDSGQAGRSAVVLGFSESPEHQSRTAPTIGGEQPDQFGIKLS